MRYIGFLWIFAGLSLLAIGLYTAITGGALAGLILGLVALYLILGGVDMAKEPP